MRRLSAGHRRVFPAWGRHGGDLGAKRHRADAAHFSSAAPRVFFTLAPPRAGQASNLHRPRAVRIPAALPLPRDVGNGPGVL